MTFLFLLPNALKRTLKVWPLTTGHWPLTLLLTVYCLLPTLLQANPPSVSYIFPAGGQRGTSVAFHVGGHYLHEVCPFEMLGLGVKATPLLHRAPHTAWFEGPLVPKPYSSNSEDYPKDQAGAVSIAPDAPLGVRRYRVWTSQGVIPTMKYVIGDFPEIVEQEIDGQPLPTPVELPVTINGRIFPREDVDTWTFAGKAGHGYTCEVMAARIGSPLDSRLEIIGLAGRPIAENVDGKGTDSFVQFIAPSDGEYQVKIHDINFAGLQHFVYRLTINDGPVINDVFPLGGRRGESLSVELNGMNIAAPMATLQMPTTTDSTYTHQFASDGKTTNPITFELSDLPEFFEQPNESATEPPALPAVFNGRIQTAGEMDRWTFRAGPGQEFLFDVRASRLGSRLDSVLTLEASNGTVLAENDNLATDQTDSQLRHTFPAEGIYTAVIRERTPRRGGAGFAYRLHVAQPMETAPDFQLQLAADALTLKRGSELKFKVSTTRSGGCDGPIELSFADLPAGVTVSETTIAANKSETQVKYKADDTAKIDAYRLTVTGTCKVGQQTIQRQAATTEAPVLDHLLLAVAMPTPFKVIGAFETNYVSRGATYFRHYTLDRGGFEGPLTISLADRQVRHLQGVTGPEIIVPAGETEFDYNIKLAPWMQPARTARIVVMAVGVVTDSDGTQHKVCYTSNIANDQIIMMVATGELSVDISPKSVLAARGRTAPLTVKIGRGQSISGPITLQLIIPAHVRGITADDVTVPADTDEISLPIQFGDNELGPFNIPLRVRATALVDGQPYTAEDQFEILTDRTQQ
ncbi:putative subtilase-type serine protease precursor [Symmachiella macrocystis]|uniref:Putative subtilase-type serine protease n=1 Tax=Symmachiella macrocystis TaxID=2527985 RepID=A0A5C6B5Y6_9PLAN|nr:hypothetical protein [Symmachiella macrocystis]TWU06911.1 putative subtilase-type serine protease precursor [Symmachiella macrocystis]